MEITLALKLNGYKYSHTEKFSATGRPAPIYKNRRGVEMMVLSHGPPATIGSTNLKALEFILNGAYAG